MTTQTSNETDCVVKAMRELLHWLDIVHSGDGVPTDYEILETAIVHLKNAVIISRKNIM